MKGIEPVFDGVLFLGIVLILLLGSGRGETDSRISVEIDSTKQMNEADTTAAMPDSLGMSSIDSVQAVPAKADSQVSPVFRDVENKAFKVGERLEFEIVYGFVRAGAATMSIPDTHWVNGRPCYHIVTTAESSKFFSNIFKVRDRVESYIDMGGIFTWKFEKHLREGHFRADKYVEHDQLNNRVITGKDTMAVPPYVQDILSTFYYSRTFVFKPGEFFDIDNYADGDVYPLRILIYRKERVEVPAGKFDCVVVEPVFRGEGLFNQKGKLTIWVTDDERKIPVLMKSKIIIGSIDAKLKKISYRLDKKR
jgi:hypothetical protein